MIVCPNCSNQNPDGAIQCEACYTPLPTIAYCPNCGTAVQSDATFCGQCGYTLQPEELATPQSMPVTTASLPPSLSSESSQEQVPSFAPPPLVSPPPYQQPAFETALDPDPAQVGLTRLQMQSASLLHLQTDTKIEIPQGLSIVHIGKPNERIPPDIDVSGFPDSDIVSRSHADLRIEGDMYYIEDIGSSNGTYINHVPLSSGNRHKLRAGDRISLGKGDKVTFIFQLS